MKRRSLLALGLALAALALPATAADKASQQAEVKKAVQSSLEKFYKARPGLKDEVAKAPGYAVFTTYGLSFLVGGAGGSGIAHDNKGGRDTYMNMAQASAGLNLGASERDTLLVFKTPAALKNFVDKGWEFGGGGAVEAGAKGKTKGGGEGEQFVSDAMYYTLTTKGLEVGGVLTGTKFWKSKELN